MPTTTTLSQEQLDAIQLEEDTKLIQKLWREFSDSFSQGLETSYAFYADHSYPDNGCSAIDYETFYDWPEGFRAEVVVHADTVEPDPEWVNSVSGEPPLGRVYILQATVGNNLVQGGADTLQEIHTTIVDGKAYFFIDCR